MSEIEIICASLREGVGRIVVSHAAGEPYAIIRVLSATVRRDERGRAGPGDREVTLWNSWRRQEATLREGESTEFWLARSRVRLTIDDVSTGRCKITASSEDATLTGRSLPERARPE